MQFLCKKFDLYNSFFNIEPSRKDDLESLLYTMVFLLKGDLPWSILQCTDPSEILKQKMLFRSLEFCKDLPCKPPYYKFNLYHIECFHFMFEYIINLDFTEEPDYELLINSLTSKEQSWNCASSLIIKRTSTNLTTIRRKKTSSSAFYFHITREGKVEYNEEENLVSNEEVKQD